MKRLKFIFVCCWTSYVLCAQISPVIPSSVSIAGTSVSDAGSLTAFSNPANIGFVSDIEFGFQYENRYFLPELSTKSLNFILPAGFVNSSFSASYFGYSYYNEILVGLGFSKNFSNKFSMGVQFDYMTTYFASSNKYHGAFFPQIGLNVKLTPNLHLGFSSFNPFQTHIKTEYNVKRIPLIFSLGSEYYFSPELVVRIQLDKEISSNYRLATGLEYTMLEFLTIKMGAYHTDYLVPCLGVKSNLGAFTFYLNGELHPLLGMVTMASVKYSFKK